MIKTTVRDFDWLNEDSRELLQDYYTREGESISDAFARASTGFSFGDYGLAQRMYDYVRQGWFMYSSPILSNGNNYDWPQRLFGSGFRRNSRWLARQPKPRGLPISCFLSYVPDTIEGQFDVDDEMSRLSVSGGGVGLHLGMRGITDKSPGAVPFTKVMDSNIMYYKQGKTRKGAVACYLNIDHPDILEFLQIRKPTGGDENRKAFNIHNAVNITQDFIDAVANDQDWDLVDPSKLTITETVKARDLWEALLDTRYKTGEPYINNLTTANNFLPDEMKMLGLSIKGSNLCNEIHLPTDEERTAVCCLSSVNLAKYDEWKDTNMIADLIKFLDNVIEYFIVMAPDELSKARYSALRSRDLGLGAMGWHEFLQKNGIPFESGGFDSAIQWTNVIFSNIKSQALLATKQLAKERGRAPDSFISRHRNCHLLAIAPNANSSIILGTSPSIEPWKANAYMHKTRIGTNLVKNPILDKIIKERFNEEMADNIWNEIITNEGSIQGMDDYFSGEEQKVFKTSKEIDQRWVVLQARHRQQHLCQGQSVNLKFPPGATKAEVNLVHAMAFDFNSTEGVPLKGLYYLRTEALRKGENIGKQVEREALKDFEEQDTDQEESDCLSCEG